MLALSPASDHDIAATASVGFLLICPGTLFSQCAHHQQSLESTSLCVEAPMSHDYDSATGMVAGLQVSFLLRLSRTV